MKDELTKNALAGILLCVALVLVNYQLFVRKATEENSRLKAQLHRIEAENRKLRGLLKKAQRLKKERKELKEEIERLKNLLPKTEDLPGLIRSIAQLARYSGVDLNRVELGKEVVYPQKHYAAINIKVSFSSTYPQLISFLEKVDSLERLVRPYNFDISASGISYDPILKVKGLMQTYRYVEAKKGKGKKGSKRR